VDGAETGFTISANLRLSTTTKFGLALVLVRRRKMRHEFEEVPIYLEWYDEGTVFHILVHLKKNGQEEVVNLSNVTEVTVNSSWLKVSHTLISAEFESYFLLNDIRYFSILVVPPKEDK
jgi:hypothetical protein